MIRVMLVDDHLLLRQGTRALLLEVADIAVVAECGEGAAVLALAEQVHPDVVLLDIRLQGVSGVDVARSLRLDLPDIKILVLSAYHSEQYVRTLFAIGVHGYLLKTASGPELVAAVRAVYRGETVLSTEISTQLAARTGHFGIAANETLSDREREVLDLVARGAGNKKIAVTLNISTRTAETHVSNIMAKLRARSRTEAVNLAIQQNIIVLE
jgi:DNA-binding NarL/FixJ family response regulator